MNIKISEEYNSIEITAKISFTDFLSKSEDDVGAVIVKVTEIVLDHENDQQKVVTTYEAHLFKTENIQSKENHDLNWFPMMLYKGTLVLITKCHTLTNISCRSRDHS